jgi:hydroxymethylpyrimidine pyrophosphatase-like HAD family hydrolase
MLISSKLSSKGQSLNQAIAKFGKRGTVIAAGDDENDISLLKAADIRIAMAHAQESLTSIAHIIAPPTQENGIITALQSALKNHF